MVFADVGSSVYYVPGILFNQPAIGPRAGFFVLLVSVACFFLAVKYAEIAARYSGGGGVVSVAGDAFGAYAGCLGGILITTDYFLTSAIGATSGISSLGFGAGAHGGALPLACVGLLLLGGLNLLGLRASVTVTLIMALGGLAVQLLLVLATVAGTSTADWAAMRGQLTALGGLSGRQVLTGFGCAWLAFSGIESMSQISPSLREPRRRVALVAMALVFGSVLATAPLLTAFSTTILARHLAEMPASDSLLAALAATFGGRGLQVMVRLSMAALLLFSANTAILGCYHVFLALVRRGFLPAALAARNRTFATAHNAIAVATLAPIAILVGTGGRIDVLGGLYAFGLLGAFVLSSAGLDLVRWREGQRGPSFWLGAATTLAVYVAWLANLYGKPSATLFGGTMTVLGMLAVVATRRDRSEGARPREVAAGFFLHAALFRLGRAFQGVIDFYFRRVSIPRAEMARLYGRLAANHDRHGRSEAAGALYRKIVELAPDDVDARMRLAWLDFRDGHIEDAVRELRAVLLRRPELADAHFRLGLCLVEQGERDQAIESFHTTVALAPQNARAFHQLGLLLFRRGQEQEAIAAVERAILLAPAEPRFHRNLGLMLDSTGRPREAARSHQAAIALEVERDEEAWG